MAGSKRKIGRILRASLAERPVEPSELEGLHDQPALVEAARYHRVVGFVYQALKDVDGVEPATLERLERFQRQALAIHLHVLAVLRRTAQALEPLGGDWLVVKGPVLGELAYHRPGLRLYQDLDLVIPRARFAEALERLEDAGFSLVDHNWNLLRRLMVGELVVAAPRSPEIDVHWDVRYDRELRRAIAISTEELAERARTVQVAGLPVRTFDPADTLVFLAMHGSKQGGDKLIWLKDIERTIANDTPDWDAVVERARAGGVQLVVGSMLVRARATVAAAVPDEALRGLLPSGTWRRTFSGLERLFPAERSSGFGTPATLLVRSMRRNVGSTLATAGKGLGHRTVRLVRTGALRRDTAQDDPDDPASRAFATGPPDSRERYLEEMLREP
jgi:hypothetical protein